MHAAQPAAQPAAHIRLMITADPAELGWSTHSMEAAQTQEPPELNFLLSPVLLSCVPAAM